YSVMNNRKPVAREIFSQPVTIANIFKGLPARDIPVFRSIVDNIPGLFEIRVTCTQGERTVIKTQNNIDIVSEYGRQISSYGVITLHTVFIKFNWLKFLVSEHNLIV